MNSAGPGADRLVADLQASSAAASASDAADAADAQGRSVDPEEVRRYNALAATWWDPDGPMWPLHRLNALRTPWVRDAVAAHFGLDPQAALPLAGLRVLDVGCAAGLLSEAMARLGADVTGIDVASRNIAMARDHAAVEGLAIDYRCSTVEALDAGPFDVVLNMEVVEHVEDLDGFMAACARCCAPDGLTVVATINRNPLAWLVAIVGAEHVLGWLPKGTHQYRKLVKPREVTALLERDGFAIQRRTGVFVNPFDRTLHTVPRTWVNYMLAAGR